MRLPRGDDSYAELLAVLRRGEAAVMACDTIYGFVGRVPDAEGAIRRIKGREETKPFLQLLPDVGAVEELGLIRPEGGILDLWPGPFTFVFRRPGGGTVACRVPEDERLRRLTADLGAPLYSTSVNRAGAESMNDPEAIEAEFGGEVALIEDSGVYAGRRPSTVVDVTERPYRILRQGAGVVPEELL